MILTFFYYKVSFLIKSDGNLFQMTKCMYTTNYLFKLESSNNLMVFMGTKDLDGGSLSTRSFYREMLELTPNQYGIFVLQVEFEDHFLNLEVY